ncbi:MAG: PEP-CTERM sorting domain-containing protein [Phycisphaerae bacterium]|nr:PEP-CTERM sorting domain-containing protein [Phycisphaerae bacterium]
METIAARRACARRLPALLTLAAAIVLIASTSDADTIVLRDMNSRVETNWQSPTGLFDWKIDGFDVATRQWLWYRQGSMTSEQSIDSLYRVGYSYTDNNSDGLNEEGLITYRESSDALASRFTVTIRYILQGGSAGSGAADLQMAVSVANTSGSALSFRLFNYADFQLPGAGGDIVSIPDGNDPLQTQGPVYKVDSIAQVTSFYGSIFPDGYEAGMATDSPTLLARLTDGAATTLGTVAGPRSPGDASWAQEWDRSIGAGQSFDVLYDFNAIVPEPATLAFLAIGGAALLRSAIRRRGR